MTSQTRIATQLRSVLTLTRTEAQVARLRRTQARTEAVDRELAQNAENADRRADEIAVELERLGGAADVVAPLVGRVATAVKGALDQAGPLEEALLGDLALEHQLRDRSLYLHALAEAAGEQRVSRLAERLVAAHTATVDWLTTVLAEYALDGPPALRPTPLQLVAGGATRVAGFPVRVARDQLNRWAGQLRNGGIEIRQNVQESAERAARFGEDARDVVITGRDAALDRAEQISRRHGDKTTTKALHGTRTRLGALHESELPIGDYDGLAADDAVAAIKKLDRVADVNTIISYEEANKDRRSVVSAAQTRHADLAKEVVGVG